METLSEDELGEVISKLSRKDIINLCLSVMKEPQHPLNNPDFWRKMIARDFGNIQLIGDPRQQYLSLTEEFYGEVSPFGQPKEAMLPFLVTRPGEFWAVTYNYENGQDPFSPDDKEFVRFKLNEIHFLGKLENVSYRGRKEKQYFFFAKSAPPPDDYYSNNYIVLQTPEMIRELSKKYNLSAMGY